MNLLRFRTAGVRVDVACDDDEVCAAVRTVGRPMLTGDQGPPSARLAATTAGDTFRVDGETVARAGETSKAAAALLYAVDRVALRLTPCLAVHAAALADGEDAVVVPGMSGTGKSTLAAAAMQRGLLLLSDEAACLRPHDGRVVPHPRPLGLSVESRGMLGLPVLPGERGDDELAVAPGLLGGWMDGRRSAAVRVIGVVDRGAGRAPGLAEAPRAAGLGALLGSCLNAPPLDGRGFPAKAAWELLSGLVQEATVVTVSFGDPHDGARLLQEALTASL